MNQLVDELEAKLRAAQEALDQACNIIETMVAEDIGYPGKMYLQAKLDVALWLVESELPEFERAALLTLKDAINESQ